MHKQTFLLVTLLFTKAAFAQDLLGSPEGLALLSPPVPSGETSSLLTDLVSYWKMDEASGNALDAHGTNAMTDTSTVTANAAGKVNGSRVFTRANAEYFTKADCAALSITNNESFSVAGWFRLYTTNTLQSVVGQFDSSVATSHRLAWESTSGYMLMAQLNTNSICRISAGNTAMQTNVWHFFVYWYDSPGRKFAMQVWGGNYSGATNSTPTAGTVSDAGAPFQIGRTFYSGSSYLIDGEIDELGFWKRVLTEAEKATLYNSGSGRAYPFSI